MAIRDYKVEISPGNFKTLYRVQVEAINEHTGKRMQRKREGITSLPKARRLEHDLWTECKTSNPTINFRNWGQLVVEYLSDFEKSLRSGDNPDGYSPQTLERKKYAFAHLKGWTTLPVKAITPRVVRTELDSLVKDGKLSKVNAALVQKEVKAAFSFAVDCGAFTVNPLASLKKRKAANIRPKRRLTHAEVNQFIHEAWQRNHPYFLRWLIPLITGMRRSEVAGLKWTDLDLERGQIRLERQDIPREGIVKNLKNNEPSRFPPIPKKFLPLFREAKGMSLSDRVIDDDDTRWRHGLQSGPTKDFCREIGITEVTYHQLRASFITNGLLEGVSTAVMKEIIGHSRLSTTDGYFRASGADLLGKTDEISVEVPGDLDDKKNVVSLRVVDSLQNPS